LRRSLEFIRNRVPAGMTPPVTRSQANQEEKLENISAPEGMESVREQNPEGMGSGSPGEASGLQSAGGTGAIPKSLPSEIKSGVNAALVQAQHTYQVGMSTAYEMFKQQMQQDMLQFMKDINDCMAEWRRDVAGSPGPRTTSWTGPNTLFGDADAATSRHCRAAAGETESDANIRPEDVTTTSANHTARGTFLYGIPAANIWGAGEAGDESSRIGRVSANRLVDGAGTKKVEWVSHDAPRTSSWKRWDTVQLQSRTRSASVKRCSRRFCV